AKGQGSTDGIGNLVTAPVDAVVWAAGAVACPSCAMEDLQAVWDAVKNLPEDLSYKGYLDTLHIMQGGGAEVVRKNAASSTELGAGLGLGAAVTGSAARALILERIAPKATVGGKPIQFDGQFYSVDSLKISQSYYERLWQQGRPAPFLQAKEVLGNNPKVMPDPKGAPGYFRYEAAGLEMIYNPRTGQIGHIQPVRPR